MSIYNSKAYMKNISDVTQRIGDITIDSNEQILFWDTQSAVKDDTVWSYFEQIRNNHDEYTFPHIRDGYLQIIQDGLYLTWEQSLDILAKMYVQIDNNNNISQLLSTGIKTDSLKESDGREIVTPSPIGIGWNVFFAGSDDDADQFAIHQQNPLAPSGRGDGKPFLVEIPGEDPDPTIEEFSFVEPIHIHDGEVNWGPDGYWDYNDRFSIGIRFSATNVESTPGTGNCNMINILTKEVMSENDGYGLIIPAAGDGYFTIDLDTACPIRNTNKEGYWAVNEDSGKISSGAPGQSQFDLYNFAPADAWLMKNIATANSKRIMEPDVYRTELIHPSWKVIMSVTKVTSGIGWLTGWFTCFRKYVQ